MSRGPRAGGLGQAAQEHGVQALLLLAKDSEAVRKVIVNHHGVQGHLVDISGQLQEHRTRVDHRMPSSPSAAVPPGLWCHEPGAALGPAEIDATTLSQLVARLNDTPSQLALEEPAPGAGLWCHEPGAALGPAEIDATTFSQLVARLNDPPGQPALEKPTPGADESCSILSTEPPAAGQSDALLGLLVAKAWDQQDTREPDEEPLHEGCAMDEQAYTLGEGVEDLIDAESPEHPRQHKTKRKKIKDEVEEPPRPGDTALVVKGINLMCRRDDVYTMLEASGFTDTFDLLYVPKNFLNHRNRGYFHINFKEEAGAEKFARLLQTSAARQVNRAIGKSSSILVAYRARYQGLRSFLTDVRRLRVDNDEFRPWVYLAGSSGRPLTKELAERLLSTELTSSGGVQSSSSNVTTN